MLSRRDVLRAAAALAAGSGVSGLHRAVAQGRVSQQELLRFDAKGQFTILHIADVHAQMRPVYFREPSVNLGVGPQHGTVPHLTDRALLDRYGIAPGTLDAYALTSLDFTALARTFGRLGGMDRIATLVNAVRAERGAERTLVLDGGDALQGSYVALQNRGADMLDLLGRLGVEATTGHWEFTYGAQRVTELFGTLAAPAAGKLPLLAGNIVDTEFGEPVFEAMRLFEKGGVAIAVIGQAFPYTPIANPRWMVPDWSFGIREDEVRRHVVKARAAGAAVVVLLSHNGFDVDRKLATRVEGIDVILTAHTHDALPAPVRVGNTLLIASGSNGKFVSRLDIEVTAGRVTATSYKLIPVVADAITPDPAMAAAIASWRAPHEAHLAEVVGHTDSLLWRRGTLNGTLDDMICQAMLAVRDAEIALSPGFRWGTTLLPGEPITREDIYDATALTYPACYRLEMTGRQVRDILEDVADNLINPDPYYQQGGDMVRVGGLGMTIDAAAPMGRRITGLVRLPSGEPLDPARTYVVTGWASVNQGTAGPPIWDVVTQYLGHNPTIRIDQPAPVRLTQTP